MGEIFTKKHSMEPDIYEEMKNADKIWAVGDRSLTYHRGACGWVIATMDKIVAKEKRTGTSGGRTKLVPPSGSIRQLSYEQISVQNNT